MHAPEFAGPHAMRMLGLLPVGPSRGKREQHADNDDRGASHVPSLLVGPFGAGSSSFGIAPQSFFAAPFFTVPFGFGFSLTRWVDRFRP
jgi:hypothetical protein